MIGTTLRQGQLAARRSAILINTNTAGNSSGCCSSAAPFPSVFTRCIDHRRARQQVRSLSTANSILPTSLASSMTPWRPASTPSVQLFHYSYHTSTPALQTEASTSDEVDSTKGTRTLYRSLSPSLRSAIITDLRSVDTNNSGRIGAKEIKALLRKHNDTFTESEILELSELFYTSLGASSVDINQFLEALDAAAANEFTSDSSEATMNPLAGKGRFKTHPLGIGTCASEYL